MVWRRLNESPKFFSIKSWQVFHSRGVGGAGRVSTRPKVTCLAPDLLFMQEIAGNTAGNSIHKGYIDLLLARSSCTEHARGTT